jgi:hypothetical protein
MLMLAILGCAFVAANSMYSIFDCKNGVFCKTNPIRQTIPYHRAAPQNAGRAPFFRCAEAASAASIESKSKA